MKNLNELIESNPVMKGNNYSFIEEFNRIIEDKVNNYDNFAGEEKANLRSFLEDVQKSGCISGMIGEFIYHADNKAFYIKHIDDLEYYMQDIEESLGQAIPNRHDLVHYTFVVWVCFEEYCYSLYNEVFEQ
jgi:hypothetical protein